MEPPAVWTSGGPICYRLSRHGGRVALVTAAKAPGRQLLAREARQTHSQNFRKPKNPTQVAGNATPGNTSSRL